MINSASDVPVWEALESLLVGQKLIYCAASCPACMLKSDEPRPLFARYSPTRQFENKKQKSFSLHKHPVFARCNATSEGPNFQLSSQLRQPGRRQKNKHQDTSKLKIRERIPVLWHQSHSYYVPHQTATFDPNPVIFVILLFEPASLRRLPNCAFSCQENVAVPMESFSRKHSPQPRFRSGHAERRIDAQHFSNSRLCTARHPLAISTFSSPSLIRNPGGGVCRGYRRLPITKLTNISQAKPILPVVGTARLLGHDSGMISIYGPRISPSQHTCSVVATLIPPIVFSRSFALTDPLTSPTYAADIFRRRPQT